MQRRKAIWALNPFQVHPAVFKSTLDLLKFLSARAGWELTPVFSMTPIPAKKDLAQKAKKKLKALFANVDIPHLLHPLVLQSQGPQQSQGADILVAYAARKKAKFIAVGTQGGIHFTRWVLGSFAEALLYRSKIPVILVKKTPAIPFPRTKVLFATDLVPNSLRAFRNYCRFVSPLNATLIIFHVIPDYFQWSLPEPDPFSVGFSRQKNSVSQKEYLHRIRSWCKKRALPYLEIAAKWKIRASFQMAFAETSVSRVILNFAKQHKIRMIALAGKSGRPSSILLGSTSRYVAKMATCPIWIYRPE